MPNRTFGWVQNPSLFENLKRTVQVFIPGSDSYNYLVRVLTEYSLIKDRELADQLLAKLQVNNIRLTYMELVGTGSKKRSEALCDALVQASISDQGGRKGYIDNWSADGFVRWAECLSFIAYDSSSDSFSLTRLGHAFGTSNSTDGYMNNEPLMEGLLSYPPVSRVLDILSVEPGKSYSKFEIGGQLGFSGENGFTSLPHNIVMQQLAMEADESYIKKMKSDREGSSDKYARMICGWLSKVGLVTNSPIVTFNEKLNKEIKLTHAFSIMDRGLKARSRIKGMSKHSKIKQHVSWYMLATRAKNVLRLRTRRALIINFLRNRGEVDLSKVKEFLDEKGFIYSEKIIMKDLRGINNCGLALEFRAEGEATFVKLLASIDEIDIPNDAKDPIEIDAELEKLKETALEKLPNIDPEFVELIEISRDKRQSEVFEMKVAEVFDREYGLKSIHLGGPSKPDGLGFFESDDDNFGIIFDTKAYKNGFNLSASEKDKMVRYVTENQTRDAAINTTKWWKDFPESIQNFNFLFVSSFFGNSIKAGLTNISGRTNTNGGALGVKQLLIGAQMMKTGELKLEDFPSYLKNDFVNFAS